MKSGWMISLLAATLAGCAATPTANKNGNIAPAATQTAATQSAVQSDEVSSIIAGMSSDSYAARQAAMEAMRQLIVRRTNESLELQKLLQNMQVSLAKQMQAMTNTADPESQARVAGLFEFQYGLTAWILDINSLPEKERRTVIEWGLLPDNVKLVAGTYARNPKERIATVKQLAKMKGPQIDWLLGQLASDMDVEVTMALLDAIWDRPLTEQIIDALWNRAVVSSTQQFRSRSNNVRNFTVRGRAIQIYEQQQQRSQEIDLIVDMMIQSKDPRIGDRLNAFFDEIMNNLRDPNDYRWRMVSSNYGDSGRVLIRLTESYKPPKAMEFLQKSIGNGQSDGYNNTFNNVQYRYSSKIETCAVLLKMNGKDPEDFGIVKHPNMGNRYMLKGAEKEEEELMKKVQGMMKEAAATQPKKS